MSDPANRPDAIAATSVQVSNELIQQYVERAHQLRSDVVHAFFSSLWRTARQGANRLLHRNADGHGRIAMS
ncbi:MAG: hypothetical protein H6945_10570 [Zoogloeaceae bacterium]|nr:hypothetical protein [Rhodocyclaceae bacterium]MCP5236166.1 hypothetical protein [Zoogloeaceae bacterium]